MPEDRPSGTILRVPVAPPKGPAGEPVGAYVAVKVKAWTHSATLWLCAFWAVLEAVDQAFTFGPWWKPVHGLLAVAAVARIAYLKLTTNAVIQ
jgi:hypothetical protein